MRVQFGQDRSYCAGSVSTATKSWFFAAARISAGPPMSMFSTQSSAGRAARHRRLERVEVDRHQIDRRDAVRRHLRQVLRQVAAAEDAAVDLRHQRLHPAVQDFRKPGVRGHVRDRHAGLAQRAGGAAGGQDLDPARGQRLGERHQPGLVGDRDQRAADWHDTGHGGTPWFGSGAG